jgi:hypothetical protein
MRIRVVTSTGEAMMVVPFEWVTDGEIRSVEAQVNGATVLTVSVVRDSERPHIAHAQLCVQPQLFLSPSEFPSECATCGHFTVAHSATGCHAMDGNTGPERCACTATVIEVPQ